MVEKGLKIEGISILWLVLEAGVGLGSGLAAHSLALFAFGLDSVIELLAAIVLFWRLLTEIRKEPAAKIRRAEKIIHLPGLSESPFFCWLFISWPRR